MLRMCRICRMCAEWLTAVRVERWGGKTTEELSRSWLLCSVCSLLHADTVTTGGLGWFRVDELWYIDSDRESVRCFEEGRRDSGGTRPPEGRKGGRGSVKSEDICCHLRRWHCCTGLIPCDMFLEVASGHQYNILQPNPPPHPPSLAHIHFTYSYLH